MAPDTLCPVAPPAPVAPRAPRAPLPARIGRRLFRASASLQLAVVLLALFAGCLALATLLESAYGTAIARELVYRTGWFALLLVLLAVNVLCAALKKFPWKRHQIGFLITHLGLLVLLLGGLLTSLAGTEGQMLLIDTADPATQKRFHLPQRADSIQLADQHQLEVYRVPDRPTPDNPVVQAMMKILDEGVEPSAEVRRLLDGHFWETTFTPGSLPWYADEYIHPRLPWGLTLLHALAAPAPRLACNLGDKGSVTVHNFYPHSESWPFSPARDDELGCAALRVRLTTPVTPVPLERWVSSLPNFERDPTPVSVELMVLRERALLPEFLHPPAAKELGKQGQLVLAIGRRRQVFRLQLDDLRPDVPVPLPGTGLKLALKRRGELMDLLSGGARSAERGAPEGKEPSSSRSTPRAPRASAATGKASYPAVQFELSGSHGKALYIACARLPHMPAIQKGDDVVRVSAWYHYPDFRWGDTGKMGVLQFLQGPGGRVYYRVYGKDGLRAEGTEVDPNDSDRLVDLPWQPMQMQFQLTAHLPHAARRPRVMPVVVPPGAEPARRYDPAVRCTLTADGRSEEFWVRLSRQATQVRVGDALFLVRYRSASRPAGFALELKKARQVNDPGTNRPASYQSDVVLTVKREGEEVRSEHSISMNHTLDYGACKVYQTSYRPLTDMRTMQPVVDPAGQRVSLSGLTVAHDPGLLFKYAGSCLLVLGIAVMFFMRAYF